MTTTHSDKSKDGKKHIAMYIGSLQKGGAERVICNLAEYFWGEGYRVTIVTTYLAPEEYDVKHAAWKRVPAGAEEAELVMDPDENPAWVNLHGGEKDGIGRVFSALIKSEQKDRLTNFRLRHQKLRRVWQELDPDLILSFSGKNNIMSLSTATKDGYKVVVSCRADPDIEYGSKSMRAAMLTTFGKAAGVVVQSNGAKNRFPKFIQKKCTILPNSVNPSFIRPRYMGEREKKVVMVARFHSSKNHAMVMEAFKAATEDSHKDYQLVFYGDGPEKAKLMSLAGSLGIEDRVLFKGNVTHVAEHIEKTRIFVLASNHEGMPNSLIEAMALGLGCISTDCPCGGPADLIENGKNGILVPVGDKQAMADAMKKLMDDDELRENLGIAATELQKRLSPEVVNAKWKEYFERVIGS